MRIGSLLSVGFFYLVFSTILTGCGGGGGKKVGRDGAIIGGDSSQSSASDSGAIFGDADRDSRESDGSRGNDQASVSDTGSDRSTFNDAGSNDEGRDGAAGNESDGNKAGGEDARFSDDGPGDGGSGSGGTDGDPAGTLSGRLPVVAAVEAEFMRVEGQYDSPLEQIRAVGRFMSGRSEYAQVLVDEDALSVTGEMQNGWIHLVGNNPSQKSTGPGPLPSPQETFPSAPVSPRQYHAGGTADNPIPSSNQARLLNAFEKFGTEVNWGIGNIRQMLTNAGWKVSAGESASVESMMAVGGDGFLYFQGHGGYGTWWKGAGGTKESWHCLQTSTEEDGALSNTIYKDDLAAQKLVIYTEDAFETVIDLATGKEVDRKKSWYGITFKAVQESWGAFSKDAVVFLNACHSGRIGSNSSAAFLDAVRSKGSPSAVFGWNNAVAGEKAIPAAVTFVDRCVGANLYRPESPAQRPFPSDEIFAWMQSKGLDDGNPGVKLVRFPATGKLALLAPSIRLVEIDEYSGEMTIRGSFGSDQGTVSVGDTPVAVNSWTQDTITCTLPSSAGGDVVVKVREIKSNPRPLTEWNLPLDYSWVMQGGMITFTGLGTALRYRLDVSGYRNKPGEAPTYLTRGAWPVPGGAFTVTGSGSVSPCSLTGGTVAIPTLPSQQTQAVFLQAPLIVNVNTKSGFLGLAIGMASSPWMLSCPGASTPLAPSLGQLEGARSFYQTQAEDAVPSVGPLPYMSVTFGSNLELGDGFFTDQVGGTMEVKWTKAVQKYPPRANDAGI